MGNEVGKILGAAARTVLVVDYAGHPFQFDLSRTLARRGVQVTHTYSSATVTPQTSFADEPHLQVAPVDIGHPFERFHLVKRLRDELSYGLRTVGIGRRAKPNVVLASNVPLVSLLLIWAWAGITRRRRVLWLQDLQSGLATMARGKRGAVGTLLYWLERGLIRTSHHVVAISDGFVDEVLSMGGRTDRSSVIENWAPLDKLPVASKDNKWSGEYGLGNKTVFLYSGTLGIKHSPELLKGLAEEFAADDDVAVVVIAEGAGADWLREQPEPLPLLLPFQPFEMLPDVLATADVLLVLLEPDAGAFSVPSKTLTYLCAGRAILGAVPEENLAAHVIAERAEAGTVVAPGDGDAFRQAARSLVDNAMTRDEMGRRAREYAADAFDSDLIADRFETILFPNREDTRE